MSYTEREENLIVFASLEEISDKLKQRLLFECRDDEERQSYAVKNLTLGVYNTVENKFRDGIYRTQCLETLEKKGIKCVTFFSEDYPERLKNIEDAPIVLYCKGNVKLLNGNCFSVVGSRRTSSTALALCKKISGELTEVFTVVTGMAEGADSSAIEGAINSGKVISVLANGVDYFYPATNRALMEKVAKEGLLVTEYLPHIQPAKYNFPARNRIIAGLSKGTLVVSAGEKSGAVITADWALEYDREVFAFPYSPGVASGVGCNALIKNGAYLTENILDIFKVFGLDLNKSAQSLPLTADERAVLEQLKITGEGFLPVIAQKLNRLPYQLIPVFSSLEIKGLVTRLGGNRYGIV